MRLAPLDLSILKELRADARLSFRELAERLGSTTPTISARVKALEDIGVLRGYHAHLDHATLGGTSYVVEVRAHPSEAVRAHAAIAALPGATRTFLLSGGRIVASVQLRPPAWTLSQLHHRLAEVQGLLAYEASEVIEATEPDPLGDLPEDVQVPCHTCKGPIHGEPVKARLGERAHVFCCRQCLADFRARFEKLSIGKRKGHGPGAPSGPRSP